MKLLTILESSLLRAILLRCCDWCEESLNQPIKSQIGIKYSGLPLRKAAAISLKAPRDVSPPSPRRPNPPKNPALSPPHSHPSAASDVTAKETAISRLTSDSQTRQAKSQVQPMYSAEDAGGREHKKPRAGISHRRGGQSGRVHYIVGNFGRA